MNKTDKENKSLIDKVREDVMSTEQGRKDYEEFVKSIREYITNYVITKNPDSGAQLANIFPEVKLPETNKANEKD